MTDRPIWPYALGAIGGVVFAIGALAMTYAALASSPSTNASEAAIGGIGIGGALLGVGWLGVFKQKQCGFGVIASSFVVPLAFLYVYLHRDDWDELRAFGMLVVLALALFAMAHLFVKNGWVRWLAGLASFGLWTE